ncbi:unnamed protein product [Meganyctiphanes norvegica]|uniref:Uncharacterized protein n=1 Tax=Meganyctiphanes norvegica TaxID=48144 RepID=A0AAV2Q3U0_MEGNR
MDRQESTVDKSKETTPTRTEGEQINIAVRLFWHRWNGDNNEEVINMIKEELGFEPSEDFLKMVYAELDKDEDIDPISRRLIEAVRLGELDSVKEVLKAGANPLLILPSEDLDMSTGTLLHLAAKLHHYHLIAPLVEAGIPPNSFGRMNSTALHTAVLYDVDAASTKVINALVDAGAKVTYRMTSNIPYQGGTALHLAASRGHITCISTLVELGTAVNIPARSLDTPLHAAASNNQVGSMEVLLQLGAHIGATGWLGCTALHVAAETGSRDAAEMLVKRGIDVYAESEGFTARHVAAIHGYVEIEEYLTKREAEAYTEAGVAQRRLQKIQKRKEILPKQLIEYMGDKWIERCIIDEENNKSINKNVGKEVKSKTLLMYDKQGERLNEWLNGKNYNYFALNIPSKIDGHFQDENGVTALHIAATSGDSTGVEILLNKCHIFPGVLDYLGHTPADLAEKSGHIQLGHLIRSNMPIKVAKSKEKKLYSQLLNVIVKGDDVFKASSLLQQGAPLCPVWGEATHAVVLAITANRPRVLTLLFASGVSLLTRTERMSLLELAWTLPDITIYIRLIVTRIFINKIKFEKKLLSENDLELIGGIDKICETLKGLYPSRAKWPVTDSSQLTTQMGSAVGCGAMLTAAFIRQAGGCSFMWNDKGQTALHVAINCHQTRYIRTIIRELSGNPFIKDSDGNLPFDMMETTFKNELVEEMAMVEFTRLDSAMDYARSQAEKLELKEIVILHATLFYFFINKNNMNKCAWQIIFIYLSSLMNDLEDNKISVYSTLQTDIDQEETKENNEKDVTSSTEILENSWIRYLHTKLCHDIDEKGAACEYDTMFQLLFTCVEMIDTNVERIQENKYYIKKECQVRATEDIIIKSLKNCCENKYFLFLHMIITITNRKIDGILNEMLHSSPLHHAVASGRLPNVVYLVHTQGAKCDALDRSSNTPAHVAYMNGYGAIGKFLIKQNPELNEVKNNSHQTPTDLKEGYLKYEESYQANIYDSVENHLELLQQSDGMRLSYLLLKYWLIKTKNQSFHELIKGILVNYTVGEAEEILILIKDFTRNLGNGIAECNCLFKGSPRTVGSVGDNCRLYLPDESDTSWILDWDSVNVRFEEFPENKQMQVGFKHKIIVEIENEQLKHLMEGTNLLEEFYECSKKSLEKLLPSLDSRLSLILPGIKRIGCGVCVSLAWAGSEYPLLILNIDLVPVMKASRPNNFPHPKLTQNVKCSEIDAIYVVQTHINNGEFRLATTLEEQYIMVRLTPAQRFVFLICKILISKMKCEKWVSIEAKKCFAFFDKKTFKLPAPTGFLLKSSFFFELEMFPKETHWADDLALERVKNIFLTMCRNSFGIDQLDSGRVKSYFVPNTQPPAVGLMAPAIYRFIVDHEKELLSKMNQQ